MLLILSVNKTNLNIEIKQLRKITIFLKLNSYSASITLMLHKLCTNALHQSALTTRKSFSLKFGTLFWLPNFWYRHVSMDDPFKLCTYTHLSKGDS